MTDHPEPDMIDAYAGPGRAPMLIIAGAFVAWLTVLVWWFS